MFDDNKGEIHKFFKDKPVVNGKITLSKKDFEAFQEGMGPQIHNREKDSSNKLKHFNYQYVGTPVVLEDTYELDDDEKVKLKEKKI